MRVSSFFEVVFVYEHVFIFDIIFIFKVIFISYMDYKAAEHMSTIKPCMECWPIFIKGAHQWPLQKYSILSTKLIELTLFSFGKRNV